MAFLTENTGLYIALVAVIFTVIFHFAIMRKQSSKSAFVVFCWDVLVFLICFVGISIIYYSAVPMMMSS